VSDQVTSNLPDSLESNLLKLTKSVELLNSRLESLERNIKIDSVLDNSHDLHKVDTKSLKSEGNIWNWNSHIFNL